MIQNGQPVDIFDRYDGVGKAVVIPSGFGPLLAFHCKRIGRIAAKAKFGCDDICANALRDKILVKGEGGIHSNSAAVASHGHPAHAFHAASDIGITRAAAHLIGGQVYRLKP